MQITKDDFKISGDTCVWMIFCILIISVVFAYYRGKIDQKVADDQQWSEDVALGKIIINKELWR